jgi:hypothetical protein
MGLYVPITWQAGAGGGTPLGIGNLNAMEDRIELLDVLYQAMGGTTAAYPTAIGVANTFLRSTGVSPQWRSAANVRSDLGLVIGTNVQAWSAELAAIAGLASVANTFPYFTGSDTAGLANLTAYARTLLDDADAGTARSTLELQSMALQSASSVAITGGAIEGMSTIEAGSIDAINIATSGELTVGGQGYSPMVTLTVGSTITPDTSQGNSSTATLPGSHTMASVLNQRAGAVYNFLLKKSAAGKSIIWNAAYKFPGGIDVALSDGANPDLFSFLSDGTNLYPAGKNLA